MDFTINLLPKLYKALQSQGFSFFSVSNILQKKEIFSKYVILRHDVEKYYENALEFARIQNELGIRGVYGDEETEGLRDGERGREGEGATGRKSEGATGRKSENENKDDSLLNLKYRFHSTNDIIKAAEEGRLPDKIMMTFHPQRWHDRWGPWVKELVMQNLKNQVKRMLLRLRD